MRTRNEHVTGPMVPVAGSIDRETTVLRGRGEAPGAIVSGASWR